jgi:uncharacterized protein (DUF58 family)
VIPAAVRAGFARLMPRPPSGPLPLALPRRRIYIVPSRFGAVYGAALFFLLLGSLNYNNNAAILLSLVLAMTAMASAVATVLFMSRLRIESFHAAEAFAGDAQACTLQVRSTSSRLPGDLTLRHEATVREGIRADARTVRFDWSWPAPRRGRRALGRVRLSTAWPLGLFHAWCVLEPAVDATVYPAPERPAAPLPSARPDAGERARPHGGDSEWHGLREFQRGDSLRDIAWKTSARHDRWLVNEMAGAREAPVLRLSPEHVASLDREAGISRLAGWVLACEERQHPWQLVLPGRDLGAGTGAGLQRRALTALAELP